MASCECILKERGFKLVLLDMNEFIEELVVYAFALILKSRPKCDVSSNNQTLVYSWNKGHEIFYYSIEKSRKLSIPLKGAYQDSTRYIIQKA